MKKIIITGGAGFIGYNLARFYHGLGYDILVVDAPQGKNHNPQFDYMPIGEFRQYITKNAHFAGLRAIFHQGACSDTMETNNQYMQDNNMVFSRQLAEYCLTQAIPFFYASSAAVYGNAKLFIESAEYEKPLNIYGQSKLDFDNWVRALNPNHIKQPLVGLRYFNVYGPFEGHKGRMASVALHHYHQFARDGVVKLFKSSHGYADGGHLRDFIYIDDVLAVNNHFFDNGGMGVFNCGTGQPQPFNEIARAVISFYKQRECTLAECVQNGWLEYSDFYPGLIDKYQPYTCADTKNLLSTGYTKPFTPLYNGVQAYCGFINNTLYAGNTK